VHGPECWLTQSFSTWWGLLRRLLRSVGLPDGVYKCEKIWDETNISQFCSKPDDFIWERVEAGHKYDFARGKI